MLKSSTKINDDSVTILYSETSVHNGPFPNLARFMGYSTLAPFPADANSSLDDGRRWECSSNPNSSGLIRNWIWSRGFLPTYTLYWEGDKETESHIRAFYQCLEERTSVSIKFLVGQSEEGFFIGQGMDKMRRTPLSQDTCVSQFSRPIRDDSKDGCTSFSCLCFVDSNGRSAILWMFPSPHWEWNHGLEIPSMRMVSKCHVITLVDLK